MCSGTVASGARPSSIRSRRGRSKAKRTRDSTIRHAGGRPGRDPTPCPEVLRRHGPLGPHPHHQPRGRRRGQPHHAREPDHLEDPRLGMGAGTEVGEGETEMVTTKDLLVRLQAPRFLVQSDEVVLSANIHNDLKIDNTFALLLELDGPVLEPLDARREPSASRPEASSASTGGSGSSPKARRSCASRRTGTKSPTQPRCGSRPSSMASSRPTRSSARSAPRPFGPVHVPGARGPPPVRFAVEIRYSPSLAGALVDALPYLVDYPVRLHRADAQPVPAHRHHARTAPPDGTRSQGDPRATDEPQRPGNRRRTGGQRTLPRATPSSTRTRSARWPRKAKHLAAMQLSDGGWGWFSGSGEHSDAHTHRPRRPRPADRPRKTTSRSSPASSSAGPNGSGRTSPSRSAASRTPQQRPNHTRTEAGNLDAFVYMVLADAGVANARHARLPRTATGRTSRSTA